MRIIQFAFFLTIVINSYQLYAQKSFSGKSFYSKNETDILLHRLKNDPKKDMIYKIKKQHPQYASMIDRGEVYFVNTHYANIKENKERTATDSLCYYIDEPYATLRYMYVLSEDGEIRLLCFFDLQCKEYGDKIWGVCPSTELSEDSVSVCEIYYHNIFTEEGGYKYTEGLIEYLINNKFELDKVCIFDLDYCFKGMGTFVQYNGRLYKWNNKSLSLFQQEEAKDCPFRNE